MVTQQKILELPTIERLKKLTQSLALLDSILCFDEGLRYNKFCQKWGEHEMLASMSNGSGDEYFIVFNKVGSILLGFSHESPMNLCHETSSLIWPGIFDFVPREFQLIIQEPAFCCDNKTFCIWQCISNSLGWQVGDISYPNNDPNADGSTELLFLLDGNPETYRYWAEEYYECKLSPTAINHIYQHRPLTEEIVQLLNPAQRVKNLLLDIEEIGYLTPNF
jgi:hypothetical protein